MTDSHLNLFLSYNRDNELIENNLTRAFIVTLAMLSGRARDLLLKILFCDVASTFPLQEQISKLSFAYANFALQNNMEEGIAYNANLKCILAITSHHFEAFSEQTADNKNPEKDEGLILLYKSIPDGWIYDAAEVYCFLIESKVGSNPVNNSQIASHAKEWFQIDDKMQRENCILSLTWMDVLASIEKVISNSSQAGSFFNEVEIHLLSDLREFIILYDYHLYRGFRFEILKAPPKFLLAPSTSHLNFSTLKTKPSFGLIINEE